MRSLWIYKDGRGNWHRTNTQPRGRFMASPGNKKRQITNVISIKDVPKILKALEKLK